MYTPYIMDTAILCVIALFAVRLQIIVNPPYGYDWDGKNLVINEEQAKHVRWIFAQTLAGVPLTRIAREMNDKGLRTVRGNAWQPGTLRDMIANERYVGDVLFQKKYTDSQFNRHVNRGEVNQYMLTDHHEPIVSREEYDAANAMIERHRRDKNIDIETDKYLKRYPFSGKIVCGICGKPFKRRVQNGYTAWWCSGHIQNSASCDMKYIREEAAENAFMLMLNKLTFGCKQVLRPYYSSLRVDLEKGKEESGQDSGDDLQQALSENKGKQDILIHLASQGLIDEALFNQERSALIAEARHIQKQIQTDMNDITRNNEVLLATRALIQMAEKKLNYTAFDEALFEDHVDHIRVEARDRITFVLKCGLELREKLTMIDGRRTNSCMGTGSKAASQLSTRSRQSV